MRRCTTVPGYGTCCRAAGMNALNTPIRITVNGRQRCAECTQVTKRNGQPGFRFRWHKGTECGIVSGCPNLGAGGGGIAQGGQGVQIPSF